MSEKRDVHSLHIEIPMHIWERFKKVAPEYGVTSIVVRRLIKAYIEAVEKADGAIDVKKITI